MNLDDIVVAENLTKSYGGRKAVDSLTLHVKKGEIFGFLGPNGAGKTTTIRLLTGVLKPDQGTISIDGHLLSQHRREILGLIGVVPESRGLYNWMTASEYLSFFAHLHGLRGDILEEHIIESLLLLVGLNKRKDSIVGTFSLGMRQRLGIARSLINNPKIIFLDEPTIGLDPRGQEEMQQLFRKLNRERVTIFISSHFLNEISNLCSRIGIINEGKLIAEGTIADLAKMTNLQDKSLDEIFLYLTRGSDEDV